MRIENTVGASESANSAFGWALSINVVRTVRGLLCLRARIHPSGSDLAAECSEDLRNDRRENLIGGIGAIPTAVNLIAMHAEAGAIRSLFLNGPAGRLEALLNSGAANASHAALVCHPHPVYGGTMHNKVVFHAAKALNSFGFPVLRFNFRGAGLSHGEHDYGQGEADDVRTALDWLDQEFHLPMIFAGFSFGAAVGLGVACLDDRVRAVIGLGVPVQPVDERSYDLSVLQSCTKPKLFVSGSRDQFGPRAKLEALVARVPEAKQLVIIESADHFFEGRLREMREAIGQWLSTHVAV